MTGEDASPAAPACRTGPTVSREMVVTAAASWRTLVDVSSNTRGSWAAPRILNLLRTIHHHPGTSLSINRATASREMIICATGAGIPHEVEASKAVHYSLPERAEPCNVHTTGTADFCAGMMLLRR